MKLFCLRVLREYCYSTLLNSILLYSTLLCSTLLYSTLYSLLQFDSIIHFFFYITYPYYVLQCSALFLLIKVLLCSAFSVFSCDFNFVCHGCRYFSLILFMYNSCMHLCLRVYLLCVHVCVRMRVLTLCVCVCVCAAWSHTSEPQQE